MGTNEKLVPGELLNTKIVLPELNVWVVEILKNNLEIAGKIKKLCLPNKINEEITHV